nr:unnamed protein product [Spirometra erinaceieuropaei]
MVAVKTEKLCRVRCLPINRRFKFTVKVSSDEHIQEGQLLLLFFFSREFYIREDCVEQAVKMLQHVLLYDDERVVNVTSPKHRFMLEEGNLFQLLYPSPRVTSTHPGRYTSSCGFHIITLAVNTVQHLAPMLATAATILPVSHEHDWEVHLPFCLLAYRLSVHSSTGFTPHYLWTGRGIRLPIDLLYSLPKFDATTPHDYVKHLREVIRSAHNAARATLGSSPLHQKDQHDRRSSGALHQIGDLVMHYNPSHLRGTSNKFHYPWQGPFVVLDTPSPTTLLIRDAIYPNARPFTTHFDEIKPYRGRLPTCSPDTLPILPADQVPPVAIEVNVASPLVDLSTEDSAPP